MFLWKSRQALCVLALIAFGALALVYPGWRRFYEMVMPPVLIILIVLAFSYSVRR
jgi:hypothetical protein